VDGETGQSPLCLCCREYPCAVIDVHTDEVNPLFGTMNRG
jgi:hypothetical protein